MSGDKGGSSTKILCQFTSSERSQSVRTAKLLGIYEGSKESRENIVCAFDPILEQLNILHKVPPSDSSSSKAIIGQHETGPNLWNEESFELEQFVMKLTNKVIRKLAKLFPGFCNENNGVFSAECEHCMNHFCKHSWTGADINIQGNITNSGIFYGGDLMWLSYILGLTGPNGKLFSNDCLQFTVYRILLRLRVFLILLPFCLSTKTMV